MPDSGAAWSLVGFLDRVDTWIEREFPSQDLRVIVLDWILTRSIDPYQGAEREHGLPNLWYARILNSYDRGTIVVCAYFIEETTRTVRCGDLATFGCPD